MFNFELLRTVGSWFTNRDTPGGIASMRLLPINDYDLQRFVHLCHTLGSGRDPNF